MAQLVSRPPFTTAETRVRFQVSLCSICGAQSGSWTGFSPVLQFSPVSIIPPTLHTHPHLHVALTRMTNRRNQGGNLPEINRGALGRKELSLGCCYLCSKHGASKALKRVLYSPDELLRSSLTNMFPYKFHYTLLQFSGDVPLLLGYTFPSFQL